MPIDRLFGNYDKPMPVGADYARSAEVALDIEMLMTVQQKPRMGSLHVAVEGRETEVHIIFAVVDHAG